MCLSLFFRYKEIAGNLENTISEGLKGAPGKNIFCRERQHIRYCSNNICVFMSSWQHIPPSGVWGAVVLSGKMLVRQSLSVTSDPSPVEAHAAALRTIRQVSWWGKPEAPFLRAEIPAPPKHSVLLLPILILICVTQVLTKTPSPEVAKESTRPLPSSASSTSSRTSVEEGGSESWSPASLSTKQLVYIAADIQKLQEKVHTQKDKLNTYLQIVPVYFHL